MGDVSRWEGSGRCSGQVGFFNKFAGKALGGQALLSIGTSPRTKRLLGVMDGVLAGEDWFLGDEYTIADISMLGWVRNLIGFYEARELVGFDGYTNVAAWLERGLARPAVQRGLSIPDRSAG